MSSTHPLERARRQIVTLAHAVESTDPAQVGRALSALASSRRILAPLGWALGTILLLFQGLRTIVVNWRLTLIELVPAIGSASPGGTSGSMPCTGWSSPRFTGQSSWWWP